MIRIEGLTKVFRNGRGIFDLSFTVGEGEVFGYLGPNGAGKSTTIRHLMGFLRPDKGVAEIAGLSSRMGDLSRWRTCPHFAQTNARCFPYKSLTRTMYSAYSPRDVPSSAERGFVWTSKCTETTTDLFERCPNVR
ncbi:hypothetical protein ALPO108162_14720 [Alicyclobacillus pomorum]